MKKTGISIGMGITIAILFFQTVQAQESESAAAYMRYGQIQTAQVSTHYGDLDGSPYFYDNWAKGEARLSDGKTYKDLLLKYDEINGQVIFKYAVTDSALAFAVPAVEFKFSYNANNVTHTAHFLNGFLPVGNANELSFYEVLSNGNTKLLKRTVKKIIKHVEYASAETKMAVTADAAYYLAKNMQPVPLKNSNKAVLTALADKADALKKYIDSNNLNAKNDDDFAKIIDYYNTL